MSCVEYFFLYSNDQMHDYTSENEEQRHGCFKLVFINVNIFQVAYKVKYKEVFVFTGYFAQNFPKFLCMIFVSIYKVLI